MTAGLDVTRPEPATTEGDAPLAGVRVIAVEQFGAGPFGTRYLSDLGADVIKVENPVTGDEEEIYLEKPTGFTWQRGELGMTTAMRLAVAGLAFDHTGQYAEYAEFAYQGP